jgi:hypothetical protein
MFIHLLVLLCVSVSMIATPAPEPDVVAQDVGGCTSGFPVCCAVASDDYVRSGPWHQRST